MKNKYNVLTRILPVALFLFVATACYSQNTNMLTVTDKTAFKVETKQVGNCNQQVPAGWQTITSKEGSTMDMFDDAHTMYAGYGILGVNTRLAIYDQELYNRDPARSVLKIASMIVAGTFGDKAVYYTDEINETVNGYQLRSIESGNCKGVALYKIFQGDRINTSYIEAMRFAFTKKDIWELKGKLVVGIACSIQCNTVLVQHEMPSFPKSSSLKSTAAKTKKDGYGYNPQLGTEYCHNPRTGENFRVDPSMNWSETGPDGPGYYGMAGNERIKMAPGRSD